MQLTAIFMLACSITLSARSISQTTITFKGENVPLEKVLKIINQQTGYLFITNKEEIRKAKPVTVDAKNVELTDFLSTILNGQPFEFVIKGKSISIKRKATVGLQQIEQTPADITGKIVDEDGQPLAGVNVLVKGTKTGTITDAKGEFTIRNIEETATLIISATNIETRELKLNGTKNLKNISVKIKIAELDEVVVNKGYYTEQQKFSASNVVSVKAADIEKQPVQNPLLALQARVPGLFVLQPSGISGSSIQVRIQGQNSIKNGNDPLYVIDGVPIESQLQSTGIDHVLAPNSTNSNLTGTGNGSPLNYLNPSDIESIDVLKDADATAIYGSRAANGAILITTKKGKAGPMKFDLNMQSGIGRVARQVDMMNIRQYLDMRYEAFRNDNIDWRKASVSANDLKVWDTSRNNDWQRELLGGNSRYTNLNASLSGGSPVMRYLVSGTYHKQTTIFPFKDFADQKGAVHFNLNANNSSQRLRMQFSGNFMFDDNKLPQKDITQAAMLLAPDAPPLLNADGSINWAPDASGNTTLGNSDANVMIIKLQRYENKTYNLLSSLNLDYTILPGLIVGSSVGYNYMQTNDYLPFPLKAVAPELRSSTQRMASFGDRNTHSWIIEPKASYQAKFWSGTLNVIIGSTFQERMAVSNLVRGTGQLSDDLLDNINSAATITKGEGSSYRYRYNALFARTNYNWNGKYILNVNARRDGSSRFGGDNHFHNFGSVGAAWIFSSENFFTRYAKHISFGKLRGSYGTVGSDQIGDYRFMSLYQLGTESVPYQGIIALYPDGLPNPELQWEETRKLQAGIDLGFLQDRLVINATFVRNRSSNQLLSNPLPMQAGFDGYVVNLPATIQNKNWEFFITGKLIQTKTVAWTSSINLTLPQNKLLEFGDVAESGYANLHVGEPIDILPYYHWLGVAPGTGVYLFADKKGNPTITPNINEDRTSFISQFPKLYGGFENTLTYEGFQASFIFQFVKQTMFNDAEIFNGALFWFPGMFKPGYSNQPVSLLNRWQKSGDSNKPVARYGTSELQYVLSSDRRFKDAWYLRLKNVAVSWDVPQRWIQGAHFRSFRLYVHVQNLATFTKYKGLDPETQSLSALPPLQVWTGGIQLGL